MTRELDGIPGWFWPADQRLFDWFLSRDDRGDLLELGCYLGKSAVLIGRHLRAGERFTVCDLFESGEPEAGSYKELTRERFERNYLSHHAELPQIVHGPTSVILDHVEPGSCRFIHVDASHLYVHVRQDVDSARALLTADGVVVFDDVRSEHTPGVALAVWEAVSTLGLSPICITTQKLYATWGEPTRLREELLGWLKEQEDLWHTVDPLGDHRLIRVNQRKKAAQPPDLKKVTADLVKVTAELRAATREVSESRPVMRRAVGWARRLGRR
ncbi:class I SAM-dependent methyltransferase [Nonomuraea sp. NPDC050663]|uniref:class I SAM-dependent methyltransferase n=1 Tax=Nonomuraea sp. NPDC050663 TaxID=3364370 RepID=UPI0037B6C2C3